MEWINLPIGERRKIVDQVSTRVGLLPQAVEKDWWVTMVLKALFSLPYAQHLSFKGGTSLSKCWKLIERFSEDIDIAIDREYLGFKGDLSKTQVSDKLRRASCTFVREHLALDVEKQLLNLGVDRALFSVTVNKTSVTTADPETVELGYQSLFSDEGYMKNRVLIEVSGRSMSEPVDDVAINSIIAEFLPNTSTASRPFMVRAVSPKRTFLEKACLLHEEFQKTEELARTNRMSRHLYDLERMMDAGIAQEAIEDVELYESVVAHRTHFFGLLNMDYSQLTAQLISFVPPDELLGKWKEDYVAMQNNMIYGKSLAFDKLIDRIKELNNQFKTTAEKSGSNFSQKIRVRFAPSPTGPLHMGGVRTALFNYLFAKKHGGDFILRIEDTDTNRYVPGAEEYIIEALNWCGIKFDEGVGIGGPHAPYRQSERRNIYVQYAQQLIDSENAYYAFDTAEELEILRKEKEAKGEAFIYNYSVRESLRNSLSLSAEEVEKLKAERNDWVIRFKIPANQTVEMHDIVRDNVVVDSNTLDDKVLWKKADELPTYHLANIVDDHLMEISHVIRGEEWLPSLPLHVLLYRAFGWESTMPQFAHLSLLLKPDGKGKLSKRDGDKMGFPVFPLRWKSPEGETSRGYREDGYFPEAFVNLLALLGWNPGTEQEIFSLEELVQLFDLNRVVKSGARFNPDKARWFNQQYLKEKSNAELAQLYLPILEKEGVKAAPDYVEKVCGMIKERATFVSDFWLLSSYFFAAPTTYDEKVVQKYWKPETPAMLAKLVEVLKSVSPFDKEKSEHAVHEWIAADGLKMGEVMNTFRLCVVGASMGSHMFDIVEMIGVDETIARIERAAINIKQ